MLQVIGEWVLLQNAAINFGLLAGACRLARVRPKLGWLIAAAAVGGLYAVYALYRPVGLSRVAVPAAMVQLALPFTGARWPRRAAATGWFFACAGGLAGVALGLGLLWERGGFRGGAYMLPPAPMWALTLAVLACGVWLRAAQGRRVFTAQDSHIGRLVITHYGADCLLPALVDTGSTLREPLSGQPCAVVSSGALVKAFGQSVTAQAARAAPFGTLAGTATLRCFRPDRLRLILGDRTIECEGWVALGKTNRHEAIVPVGMLYKTAEVAIHEKII